MFGDHGRQIPPYRGERGLAGKVVQDLVKVLGRIHGDGGVQGGFGGRRVGQNRSGPSRLLRRLGQGEGTPNGAQGAIERELSHAQKAVEAVDLDLLGGREDAQGQRQVIRRTFLAQSRWRKVDGDAFAGPAEAEVLDGAFDPLLAFSDCTVGQPHHEKVNAAVHPHFHGNRHGIDAP